LATPANTYTRSVCATNEIVGKGACALGETSCNFVCWYASCLGVSCMATFLQSGNTYFMDCFNSVNNFRQRSCIFFLQCCKDCYCSCIQSAPTSASACLAHKIIKSEIIARGGELTANNSNLPLLYFPHCAGQRICPFTIANGSQLSNTEVEYLGRFIKCNYNVITHADCRLTLISPGFWNQSSAIACFKNCYCCSLDRTTANTSGLTINCGLYYTTDNAATFNRLCVPLPACIFQQVCGNCCCQFTVRYGLSSFACCNYVYTGWIISDCALNVGSCAPNFYKTGHSRVCIHTANSQPNYDTWTHFPDVPLPFYTIAFCDEYFAGVSPMRTDGYQSVLGIQNQASCTCLGQYAMMFSFGKVGDCVRVSCDHFVRNEPAGLVCFTPCSCGVACCSVPAITQCIFNTCFEDYFQGHGSNVIPNCYYFPPGTCQDGNGQCRLMGSPTAASHTLIYKNPNCQADSKAFLVGWRSFAMLYGGVVPDAMAVCMQMWPCGSFPYNCCTLRGRSDCGGEVLPSGCGYFRNTPGVNIWCYGSQANNTMQGTELDCVNAPAIGGSADSWTNFALANAKIVGCRLVLAGTFPPFFHLCACCSDCAGTGGCGGIGLARCFIGGAYGCQNATGQIGHTTVINTDGVVGTIVCCFDSMFHQTPFNGVMDGAICLHVMACSFDSGRCFCCISPLCYCVAFNNPPFYNCPMISDYAGLKTINMYGSSNSIYSVPSYPNMPPRVACQMQSPTSHGSLCTATCYASPALKDTGLMRSDKSAFCTIDAGDGTQCQWGSSSGPFRPNNNSFCYVTNPGVANAIMVSYRTHVCTCTAFMPCCFAGIYTPPNCSQDMTAFGATCNFCYLITPHRDKCLDGPYCFNQSCECFGPNCCLAVPCSPCCPCCNTVLCTQNGAWSGTYCALPHCCITRALGYHRQNIEINCISGPFPSCSTPPRFCCSAFAGCPCAGNQHFATAAANSVFQCAMVMSAHRECPGHNFCQGCCCSASNTQCALAEYDRLLRTCNQAGSNCLWYDFISSYSPSQLVNDGCTHLPCKSFFNKQYLMDIALCCNSAGRCLCGLCYSVNDDSKKAGYRLYTAGCCPAFCPGSPDVAFPILYATQTRGSGAPLNSQNSIHIAYFDLIPFRCCVSGGGGFFANGNACPSASGLTCCLMFSKLDTFYNVS
jgi:hypothetical protein